ncbi:dephospho-CoA kinase [Salinimonas lutimaris]|uniref:dephospho-CoA kinase n=1 Tax=Salinimonas lutimaris TaxID=914153 RepID=UPI0010BFCD2E|nr:dephospho-CoA kinase [Salinimonas lutimaris]
MSADTKPTAPFVVGLTGGIGSGKTAVSDAFARRGVPVIDADLVARQVVMPGTPALAQIAAYFGHSVLQADGSLNRPALREKVFNNTADKQWLNSLLHPAIREKMHSDIAAARYPYCILAVPLLIENGLDKMAHRVLVVDCREATQLQRAMQRDGSSETVIKNIMASQASRQTRLQAADDVLDNDGELTAIDGQVDTLHQQYLGLSRGH